MAKSNAIIVYVYEGMATGITYINIDTPLGEYRAIDWADALDFLSNELWVGPWSVVALDGGLR